MNKSLLTAAALISALSLSPAAFAQNMLAGKTISDKDLPLVKSYCDSLARKAISDTAKTDAAPGGGNNGATTTAPGNDANKAADASSTNDQPFDVSTVTSVDLTVITLDDCTKAGLTTSP